MEVKENTGNPEDELLNRFWPNYHQRALFVAMASQVVVILLVIFIVLLLYPSPSAEAWAMMMVVAFIMLVLAALVTNNLLRPLKDLSAALVQTAGERSSTLPPNINARYYAHIHLRPLLKQVLSMSAKRTDDIDEAKKSSAKTLELSGPLNHTSTGIIMLSESGEIVYSNQSAPVHVDGKGKKSLELIFDVDQTIQEWLAERGDHDIHAEKVWRRISNKLTGEENRRIYDVFVSYEKGSEIETIITCFDRTDEYQPEDDDLDFIAFAAHELRGPITVIRGYLDTLNDELETKIDGDQKELFQRLIVSANRLSGYINNILNASRFDRRHLKVHMSEMTVQSIYATIADDMQLRAAAQQRLLSVDFPTGLPTVAADLNSMSEVMGNLIDNAIKYSSEGGSITVSAAVKGDFVEVSVTDQGIGMPANVIANLFHKFYRSHRSRETVAGTGIGLYISKAIVESNGGTIGVRSVEGHGSTFTFSLPIYATVADKLQQTGTNNQGFIEHSSSGWIKNHGAFRG
jgi:signal transduction histidine kinase